MKVFTPAQSKSVGEDRVAKDARRATVIADITKELLEEKTKAEIEFEESMTRQREEAEKWYTETLKGRNELEKEVKILEERRRLALMPPLIKAEDIHSVEEELWARKLEVDLKENDNEDASRALMVRLDEVSERELDLNGREKRIKQMEQGAEIQKNQVATNAKKLSLRIDDFEKRVIETETNLAFQQSELDAKTNLYAEKERMYEEREVEIQAAKRLLADERLLLDKGFEELRRLKEKHGSTNRSLST